MYFLDCRRNLDYVRPDRTFRNLSRVVRLQVCGTPVMIFLHRRSLWLEVCVIERLRIRMVRVYNYECCQFQV
jgi:hypothetical protein